MNEKMKNKIQEVFKQIEEIDIRPVIIFVPEWTFNDPAFFWCKKYKKGRK